MKIIRQAYVGEKDMWAMTRLARECQAETLHVTDLLYRLSSWAMDTPENVGLWVDENDVLAAWAVMQTPFWSIDIVTSPHMQNDLFPQVLEWADERAKATAGSMYGHPAWFVNVFSDQMEMRSALEQAGFSDQANAGEDGWSKVWMERGGQAHVPEHPAPKGFVVRSLAGESEVEAYVELHQAVFESKNMTTEWRMRMLRQPGYQPELDVVVAAPGGNLVAFCIGWLSEEMNGDLVGQIEPLGCHADYRGYALGRVALCEVMRRLQQHGAVRIYVETDNYRNTAFRLYESVGYRVVREVRVYRKDYPEEFGHNA